MKQIKLKVETPEKVILSDEVSQVSLNTKMGQITVLPNHIPLVSQLISGEIIIKKIDGVEDWMAVSGGFVEVMPEQVIILADTAEYAFDIDEARAEEAKNKAEELLKQKVADSEDYAMVTAKIQKEMARLRVVRRRKKK